MSRVIPGHEACSYTVKPFSRDPETWIVTRDDHALAYFTEVRAAWRYVLESARTLAAHGHVVRAARHDTSDSVIDERSWNVGIGAAQVPFAGG